jgi:hypothetical protein
MIIFITVLHNKPYGFGASVASAAGPLSTIPPKKINNQVSATVTLTEPVT